MIRNLALIVCLVFGIAIAPAPASAQSIRVMPGDTIGLAVAGLRDLDREMLIDYDGYVTVPLIGRMKVAGLTIDDIQEKVAFSLASQIYRQRGISGMESLFAIALNEVSVFAVSYRPVYVSGYVAMPGAYDFRPELTAQRAIALAGGFYRVQTGMQDPEIQLARLNSEERQLRAELVGVNARIDRLFGVVEAGLREEDALSTNAPVEINEPELTLDSGTLNVDALETLRLDSERSVRDGERRSFQLARQGLLREIEALQAQLDAESEGEKSDQAEFERLAELLDKGLVSADRTATARRAYVLSSTRRLETSTELADRQRQLIRVAYELDKLKSDKYLRAMNDLSKDLVIRSSIEAELVGIREQKFVLGAISADDEDDAPLTITIVRADGSTTKLTENEDLALRPGDLITVDANFDDGM
ncbi:MAG: polysaccharide biosynthesis/export family protein [Pseudomonadota bacterium]